MEQSPLGYWRQGRFLDPVLEFDNSGDEPLLVPGFGHPINVEQQRRFRFSHGIMDAAYERLTVKELAMLQLMDAITDKPIWWRKILNENIVQTWRQEALQMPLISEQVFDWCLMELRDKAGSNDLQYVTTLDTQSRCVKADGLIPSELQKRLKKCVRPLFDQPKDWHPGSGRQVLNLVHPSLYPLVYGKTPILQHGPNSLTKVFAEPYDAIVAPVIQDLKPNFLGFDRDEGNELARWSTKFQWLPCEVEFQSHNENAVKITSYINNLHPRRHSELYTIIERLIEYSIPAWNDLLPRPIGGRTPFRIAATNTYQETTQFPQLLLDVKEGYPNIPWNEAIRAAKEYVSRPDAPRHIAYNRQHWRDYDKDELDTCTRARFWEILQIKYDRMIRYVLPEPGTWHNFNDWKCGRQRKRHRPPTSKLSHTFYSVDLAKEFMSTGLQVIVKLAGIELTPEKPTYAGGSWHLEGMLNEHIVATAIYYYDSENITKSRIRFRHEASADREHIFSWDDRERLQVLFGDDYLADDHAGGGGGGGGDDGDTDPPPWPVQELGSIATPEGRLLAFPNTLQHRVEPFGLVDRTRPGHRRFVVLWLVDPYYRILSTRNVPPQQREWWDGEGQDGWWFHGNRELSDALAQHGLPREVQLLVKDHMDRESTTMTREEALAYRLELMAERTALPAAMEQGMQSYYNLCEH